jgi:hypothetical protein
MAISDLTILNGALVLVGLKKADSLAEDRKAWRVYEAIYEQARNEIFDLPHDWQFATARKKLRLIYQLTIDSVPTAVAWDAGATLTGASSGTTCIVISKVSNTVYLVTEPQDSAGDAADFTDGEIISDGTNSCDCGVGYPVIAEKTPDFGYDHQYRLPSGVRRVLNMVDEEDRDTEYEHREELYVDDADNEIDVLLTDEAEAFVKFLYLRTDVSTWPAWFARLVILNLAIYLCEPMKSKQVRQNQLERMYIEALDNAIKCNGMQSADVNSSNVNLDKGNTDVLNASSDEGINKNYIVQRE